MLIEIDGSAVEDAVQTSGSQAVSRDCIENLLLAHHDGKHVVYIKPEHVAALTPVAEGLSPRARGALRSIKSQQSEIRGLRNRLRWILRVGLGPTFNRGSVTQEGKAAILVPLHDFHDQERLGRAVLLGENLTDAALYLAMGRAFLAFLRWRTQQLSFTRQGGGGSTTASCFEELVKEGTIVLTIVDSDRKHPDDAVGGTAAKVLSKPRTALQEVHVLHVRFAENLLSSAIYVQAFTEQKKEKKLASLTRLMQAEALPSPAPWRDHADLKHGIRLFQVRGMAPGSQEAAFWSSVAGALQRGQCQDERTVPCGKVEECRCYVTDVLGSDALELAVAWIEPRDPARNARLLGITRNTPTGDLCEKVLAWGIALAARQA
ncbi:MAG TPA: hypothetical protein VLS89_12735 [Candidatus Nanopelagicales bacterium]|nr:hypothetical protein [Candidatus Nanopelagicales bacterium]